MHVLSKDLIACTFKHTGRHFFPESLLRFYPIFHLIFTNSITITYPLPGSTLLKSSFSYTSNYLHHLSKTLPIPLNPDPSPSPLILPIPGPIPPSLLLPKHSTTSLNDSELSALTI